MHSEIGGITVSETNPWLSQVEAARPPQEPAAPAPSAPAAVTGPQPGAVAPVAEGAGLPYAYTPTLARWWWLGCHGGAGVSTLCQAVPGGTEAGRYWPMVPGTTPAVVLVARTSASGLLAAQTAARQWASGSLPSPVRVLGLVAVADAPGRLPGPLRDLLRLVSGGVPHVWRVPWTEAWRLGASAPAPADLARDLHKLTD